MIIAGLPAGTTIELGIVHRGFTGITTTQGGSQGGNIETFDSEISLEMTGTGALQGFSRSMVINAPVEIHTGPPTPGAAVQSFDTEMVQLEGVVIGDPDFDLLHITAGSGMGLPSPGATTVTNITSPGNPQQIYRVDSFFDVNYQIEFVGAPGSALGGLSGVTTGHTYVGTPGTVLPQEMFRRGDVNDDGLFDIADPVGILGILFSGVPQLCEDSADANDDGGNDIGDAIFALSTLFSMGAPPPAPGTVTCGADPTADALNCQSNSCF